MRERYQSKLSSLFAGLVATSAPCSIVLGSASCESSGNLVADGRNQDAAQQTEASDGDATRTTVGDATSGRLEEASVDACASPTSCCPFSSTLDGGLPDANDFADGGSFFPPIVDGGPTQAECRALCGPGDVHGCEVASEGPPAILTCYPECTGRRPANHRAVAPIADSSLGAYFATMAQLEAASVVAFRRMARELAAFGAPRRLVRGAERAAREEIRHARSAAAIARRFGASVPSFDADIGGARSLEDFAIENAIEGCARETYGALVATWQATHAGDAQIRAHMTRIAREETSHATLAHATHAWARSRLDRAARGRLDAALATAMHDVVAHVASIEPDIEIVAMTGQPRAARARSLARGLFALAA